MPGRRHRGRLRPRARRAGGRGQPHHRAALSQRQEHPGGSIPPGGLLLREGSKEKRLGPQHSLEKALPLCSLLPLTFLLRQLP